MDPALATRHGAPYVHLAAFSIDVDRVRALVERETAHDDDVDLPFGWEVFLTEAYVRTFLDLEDELDRLMVADACRAVLRLRPTDGEAPLGSQLPFAVYDAVERGAAPAALGSLFRGWKHRPDALVRALSPLWDDPAPHVAALADLCIDAPVDPPLSEPTARALDDLHDGALT